MLRIGTLSRQVWAARPGASSIRSEVGESKLGMCSCFGRRSKPVRGSADHPHDEVCEIQQILHLVASDEDGAPVTGELANGTRDELSVSRAQLGERFIRDQTGRLPEQRQPQFDPPPFPARHFLRRLPSQRFDVEPGDRLEIEGVTD